MILSTPEQNQETSLCCCYVGNEERNHAVLKCPLILGA